MYQKVDDKYRPLTLILKGEPGTGKTHKAAQFPSPVIFAFDKNLNGLMKLPKEIRDNVRIVDPRIGKDGKEVDGLRIWDNFIEQLEAVCKDDSVRTIVIDSLTTLANLLMDKVVGSDKPTTKVQIQHWGEFGRYLKWLGENLMCASDLDKNVIIIAHEQLEKNELTQEVKFYLNIGGQMKMSFDLYFTDCWRCYAKQTRDGIQWWVRTLPANQFNAKCSLNLPVEFHWDTDKGKVFAQIK